MIIYKLLDFIAPEDCLQCRAEGSIWCDWCRLSSDILPSRCFLCHKATKNFAVCKKCKQKTKVKTLFVAGEYKGVTKQIINNFKYKFKRHASLPIAKTLADTLPLMPADTLVVNVPTSPKRIRQRGFDHTALLARHVAKTKGLKYANLLVKLDDTQQVGSSRRLRMKQTVNAYAIKNIDKIKNLPILVIDDVVTTGSTLSEVCDILKKAGAKRVDCAVFAYQSHSS
jgi:ComF family protein